MKTKILILLVFLVLFAVIIIQNNQSVPFKTFFWSFDLPKVILVPLLFFLGFLFGLVVGLSGRKRKPKKAAEPPAAAEAPGKA